MHEVVPQLAPVPAQHARHALDRLELASHRREEPRLEVAVRRPRRREIEDLHRRLLERPGPTHPLDPAPQFRQRALLRMGQRSRMPQPVVLGSRQRRVAVLEKTAVLAAAHEVDGDVQVLGDVELVEHDLRRCAGKVREGRLDVGSPHVHGDALDRLALSEREALPERVEARLFAVVGDIEHDAAFEIADDGDVLVTPLERRLIDADVARRDRVAPGQPTPDGAPLDPGRLVPRDPQVLGHRADARLLQPVDRQRLEQRRELRARLAPRHRELPDPVRRAVEPRHPRVDHGLELAGVEVAPLALLVIVDRGDGQTLRAHPAFALRQRNPDMHFADLLFHLDSIDRPRAGEAQERGVQLAAIEHARPPGKKSARSVSGSGAVQTSVFTHTIPGRAKLFESLPSFSGQLIGNLDIPTFHDLFIDTSSSLKVQELKSKVSQLQSQVSTLRGDVERERLNKGTATARLVESLESTTAELRKLRRTQLLVGRVSSKALELVIDESPLRERFLSTDETHSFVLSIDIRRSTDLMLKATSAAQFSDFLQTLCTGMREIVIGNNGVFDKFTGDGILAFFPEFYSGPDAAYYSLRSAEMCHRLFHEVYKSRRSAFKAVPLEIGLGIGIDCGTTTIVTIADGLTVVGVPVVYACRLSNSRAGSTLVNQQARDLFITQFGDHVQIEETSFDFKNEGMHVAYAARLTDDKYEPVAPSWSTGPSTDAAAPA
jgi:hypothetical protein